MTDSFQIMRDKKGKFLKGCIGNPFKRGQKAWNNAGRKEACKFCKKLFSCPPSDKGIYCSSKCKIDASKEKTAWNKSRRMPEISGENHYLYKGEAAGYSAKHAWMKKMFGKANKCAFDISHKSTRYHWANISKSYSRDRDDWASLCPQCHGQYDSILSSKIRYEKKGVS